MSQRRVLVLGDTDLFSSVVIQFLRDRTDVEIAVAQRDDPNLAVKVRAAHPDIVVVPGAVTEAGLELVARLLAENNGVTVVTVDLQPDAVTVYRSEQITDYSGPGLVTAIEQACPLAFRTQLT